jgi:inorganic pyrophosphatase
MNSLSTQNGHFWDIIDQLLATGEIVVDRPKGSAHPRYPGLVYPLDYGYVDGTQSGDGYSIDVWLGADRSRGVTAIACTVDILKRDAEIKILLGCSEDEIEAIQTLMTSEGQGCIVLRRAR